MTSAPMAEHLRDLWVFSLVRWTVFSLGSFTVVFGLTVCLREFLGMAEKIAFLVPLILVFFMNFIVCRYFVFQNPHDSFAVQFVRYSSSVIGFRLAEYLIYWLLLDIGQLWYVTCVLIVMPTSFVTKYAFFKFLVFGTSATPRASS